MTTPQSQRTCPGVDGRPRGIFVPVVDRDPHPVCAQCCGVKHDGILTCDSSVKWTEDRWENFNRKKKKLCRQDYSSKSSLSGSAFGSFFPAEHSRQAFVMSCCTVTPQPVSGNNDAVPNLLLSDSLDASCDKAEQLSHSRVPSRSYSHDRTSLDHLNDYP